MKTKMNSLDMTPIFSIDISYIFVATTIDMAIS